MDCPHFVQFSPQPVNINADFSETAIMGVRVSRTGVLITILFALAFAPETYTSAQAQTPGAGGTLMAKNKKAGKTKKKRANPDETQEEVVEASGVQPTRFTKPQARDLLEKVLEKEKQCARVSRKKQKPFGVCAEPKVLFAMENLLRGYIEQLDKTALTEKKNSDLSQENQLLKSELRGLQSKDPYKPLNACQKRVVLTNLLINEGIPYDGSSLFIKTPQGNLGTCWTNSRKKTEATITMCEYPLAIFIKTMGGKDSNPVRRERQYLFSTNGCDLEVVQLSDETKATKRVTYLTYDQCKTNWNKRGSDAALKASEFALIEDTIGACFREQLLPPRGETKGVLNPDLPPPVNGPLTPVFKTQ